MYFTKWKKKFISFIYLAIESSTETTIKVFFLKH